MDMQTNQNNKQPIVSNLQQIIIIIRVCSLEKAVPQDQILQRIRRVFKFFSLVSLGSPY
ncbi:hypothetical protein TTHERM_000869600 (macronuclear) [Tetrahymena thermophila SB210]|uniref:Uncharacterized protein n=1 Tax=Tetrahymena thermophila (strain SB210) TaxID=312017 RepID=W7XBF4_TETTS|nr:hypothetical protein TTHERM_000869600 [Tetrahymena thermophila SB210]EWS76715.1 hypothetical protein TTHERM_000869600 [Tetrahymena thermophila SB210]|eukprot:XP_012650747.1 hypothetical protein TTHERM_000869600 [Tetrahymena thermophila SB210]